MNTIRQRREALGWTIRELAEKVGSDISSVSHWENEKKIPRPTKKRKLAEVLNCSLSDLFPELKLQHEPQEQTVRKWFDQAWEKRWILTLRGWADIAQVSENSTEKIQGYVVNDYIIIDRPLDMVVVPVEKVLNAPKLFYQNTEGDWVETEAFAEFEQGMVSILNQKRILRNDIVFWHHEEGVCLQPPPGKERRFNQITKTLMEGVSDSKHEYISLEI